MKHGIVGRIKEGNFRYHGWPSVCRDENGVLYAVCSGHRLGHVCPYGKNIMYISRNDGETWSCPIIVNDTALDDRDAGIVPMGNGRLLLSWFNLPRSFFLNQESALVRGRSSPRLLFFCVLLSIFIKKRKIREKFNNKLLIKVMCCAKIYLLRWVWRYFCREQPEF